jgi:hypothetical protein
MARTRKPTSQKPAGYLTTSIGPTLLAALEKDRIQEEQKTGIKPSKNALLKRIICEKYGLDLKYMAEK